MSKNAHARSGKTQRITESDLADGRIRIPSASKPLLPTEPRKIQINLKGNLLEVHWNPRTGPDRERSGVLSVSRDSLQQMVGPNEILPIVRTARGTVYVGDRGSKLRIAQWVNDRRDELNDTLTDRSPTLAHFLGGREPDWRSPLHKNSLRELSDDLWHEARLPLPDPIEDSFWPKGGPHWDGVAVLPGPHDTKGILLVEAKSHTKEVLSGCDATPASIRTIENSLREAKEYIGVPTDADWTKPYYQAANRLAFLYYLRARRSIPAWLFNVYFVGDSFEVDGAPQPCPPVEQGWTKTVRAMHAHLGLPGCHPLVHFTHDLFLPAKP